MVELFMIQQKVLTAKLHKKRDSTKSYADVLLKNEFNVLMTRGVHGLYIHAVDPELQKALESFRKKYNVHRWKRNI